MNLRLALAGAMIASLLAGCSFENKYEREADKITRAVINDDMRPVAGDFDTNIHFNRAQVAGFSDELNAQGKLLSIKERTDCDPGFHCFDVKFEKRNYVERMRLNEQDKVVEWKFHAAPAG